MIAILLGALIGGAGFRLRGWSGFERLIGRGATTARIAGWAAPLALLCVLTAPLPWWGGPLIGLALWAGAIAPWWGSLDFGRMDGTWLRDAALHALRGVVWVVPVAAAVALLGGAWWCPLAAGLLCVPAYELGYRLRPAIGTEIGEIIFGACIGAALIGAV